MEKIKTFDVNTGVMETVVNEWLESNRGKIQIIKRKSNVYINHFDSRTKVFVTIWYREELNL